MLIEKRQLDGQLKKIGELKGRPIFYCKTLGGLHIITKADGSAIGTAPHAGIARHIAQRHEPEIQWTELKKSEHFSPEAYSLVIPQYEEMTEALIEAQKRIASNGSK